MCPHSCSISLWFIQEAALRALKSDMTFRFGTSEQSSLFPPISSSLQIYYILESFFFPPITPFLLFTSFLSSKMISFQTRLVMNVLQNGRSVFLFPPSSLRSPYTGGPHYARANSSFMHSASFFPLPTSCFVWFFASENKRNERRIKTQMSAFLSVMLWSMICQRKTHGRL